MSAHVSGVVWSSLCFEQTDSLGDNEGLLLGQVISHVTNHISDSQMKNVKEETLTYIHGHIPCHGTFSWYNSSGKVMPEKLRQLLPKSEHEKVIGWYKCRRNSSLSVSLREKAIHKCLKERFPEIAPQNFLFVLFTSSANQKMSTHSLDHLIMSHNGRQLQRLSLQISNLKETSHGEYKLQGNPVASPLSSGFKKAISAYQNEFFEKSGDLRDVANIRHLNSTMHKQLREMGLTIMGQEHELHKLSSEIQALQDRLDTKVVVKSQTNTGSAKMIGDGPKTDVKKSDDLSKKSDHLSKKSDHATKSEVKKPNYLNTGKKQPNQVNAGAPSVANQQRAAAPSSSSVAVPSNSTSGIRDDLKDLFSHSPSSSVDDDVEVQAPKTNKKPVSVGEGEEDKTPLLQPIQLHSSKSNAKSVASKIDAKPSVSRNDTKPSETKTGHKDLKRPTEVNRSSANSVKQCNAKDKTNEKGQGSKDAFGFISEIIKLESPVDREAKGIEGNTLVGGKTAASEENNKTSQTKTKTVTITNSAKKNTLSKDSGCHIRELSASPSRAVTRERSASSPTRVLKGQGRAGASSTQQKGARSRSGSRGRGVKQSSSPTF